VDWSPRDLSRQRRLVAVSAVRAEQTRRRFGAAQRNFALRMRAALGSPTGMVVSFASGLIVGRALVGSHNSRGTGPHAWQRLRALVARLVWLAQVFDQFRAGWQAHDARQSAGGASFDG
jgi:hypothetical protein